MRKKYISTQSNKLLSYFNERDKSYFGNSEAFNALESSGESAVKELLSDMTKRGLLMRLKGGIYYTL
jgi:predicted transcriptional regulator of viral defense system